MDITGIGTDIVDIKKFAKYKKADKDPFLTRNFTAQELAYCFSFKDAATHLAGTFAAKEAVFKSLSNADFLFSLIEIRREKDGKPTVWIKDTHETNILVSISHTKDTAIAVAIRT